MDRSGVARCLESGGAVSRASRRHSSSVGVADSGRRARRAGRLHRQHAVPGGGDRADSARRRRGCPALRSPLARVGSPAAPGVVRVPHSRESGASAADVLSRADLRDPPRAHEPGVGTADGGVVRFRRPRQGRVRHVRAGRRCPVAARDSCARRRVRSVGMGRSGDRCRGRRSDDGWVRSRLRAHDGRVVSRFLSIDAPRRRRSSSAIRGSSLTPWSTSGGTCSGWRGSPRRGASSGVPWRGCGFAPGCPAELRTCSTWPVRRRFSGAC